MVARNITLDGKEYMLVPRKMWEKLTRRPAAGAAKSLKPPAPLPDGSYGLEHVRISLANKVASRRRAAGLTQAQLAQLARIRVETISRLENGLHMPSAKTFDKIEQALNRAARRPAA
jgi:ribosome-binding protein aMBF1 (putative translation factor)